jgi:hypothetical protein
MKFKQIFILINLAILAQPQNAQNFPYDPCVLHIERIHAVLRILEHEKLVDEKGNYNKNGKFINNELKRFKTDSDLAKSSNQKNCASCPNYNLTLSYIEHLKAHKHKLIESDQEIIDNLKPFLSQQECKIQLYGKIIQDGQIIHKLEEAPNSWWNSFIVLGIGIIIGYVFQHKSKG